MKFSILLSILDNVALFSIVHNSTLQAIPFLPSKFTIKIENSHFKYLSVSITLKNLDYRSEKELGKIPDIFVSCCSKTATTHGLCRELLSDVFDGTALSNWYNFPGKGNFPAE